MVVDDSELCDDLDDFCVARRLLRGEGSAWRGFFVERGLEPEGVLTERRAGGSLHSRISPAVFDPGFLRALIRQIPESEVERIWRLNH